MNKHHLLLIFINTLCGMNTVFSCPCMPSSKNSQPFFEQYDEHTDEIKEEDNSEETAS